MTLHWHPRNFRCEEGKIPYVRNDFGMSNDTSLASAQFLVAKIENSLSSMSHEFLSWLIYCWEATYMYTGICFLKWASSEPSCCWLEYVIACVEEEWPILDAPMVLADTNGQVGGGHRWQSWERWPKSDKPVSCSGLRIRRRDLKWCMMVRRPNDCSSLEKWILGWWHKKHPSFCLDRETS